MFPLWFNNFPPNSVSSVSSVVKNLSHPKSPCPLRTLWFKTIPQGFIPLRLNLPPQYPRKDQRRYNRRIALYDKLRGVDIQLAPSDFFVRNRSRV